MCRKKNLIKNLHINILLCILSLGAVPLIVFELEIVFVMKLGKTLFQKQNKNCNILLCILSLRAVPFIAFELEI